MTSGLTVTAAELIKLRHQALLLNQNSNKHLHTQFGSGHISNFRGRGMDFEETRIYQNDDVRNIDWRVTARTGNVHTKVFREERERPVLLLVDFTATMFFGSRVAFKSVIAAQTAAALAWAVTNHGDRIGGILFSENKHIELRPRSRNAGVLPLIKNLVLLSSAPAKQHKQDSLTKALQRLNYVTKPGSLIYIISDFSGLNSDAEVYLNRLSQQNKVAALFVYDKLEQQAPPANHYAISDGHNIVTMDTKQKKFRKDYEKYFEQRFTYIQSTLYKQHITLLTLATHQPIIKTLRAAL